MRGTITTVTESINSHTTEHGVRGIPTTCGTTCGNGVVSGSYLLFYRVTADTVEIVRVLHGARDLGGVAEDWD